MKSKLFFTVCTSLALFSNTLFAQTSSLDDDPRSNSLIAKELIDLSSGPASIEKLSGEGTKDCPYIGYTSVEVSVLLDEREIETSFRTFAVTSYGNKVMVAENQIIPGKKSYVVEFLAGTCTKNILIETQK